MMLPMNYENYVFDLYGTLVDIHTDEGQKELWEKLALFFGYYGALYDKEELKERYEVLVKGKEAELKLTLEGDPRYSHEASPEIEITEVFMQLFAEKGVEASKELAVHAGQMFRVLSTEYIRLYEGTSEMLAQLKENGKKVYLLSNAQRIFTAYELNVLDITKYFDGIMISSDYKTKKPDKRFFDLMLKEYQIFPENTLFVGNDSRTDIKGAQSVGLDTFYVQSNISPEGDTAPHATYRVEPFESWKNV